MPVLTLFRPRCVWSKGKAMGQSVQLLMVTLRPGSERRGWGRGSGCWKGTAGDAVDGKGCPGTPPQQPPAGEDGGARRMADRAGDARSAEGTGSGKGRLTGALPHTKDAPGPGRW